MKELDATQVEQLKTIGAYLGRERKERGVSLDEIAVKTYIPLRLLQALEEGQVERLPEPVFVQGFIRRFADAIGLDGVALAKTFSPQPSFLVERKAPTLERQPVPRQPTLDQPIDRSADQSIDQPLVHQPTVNPPTVNPPTVNPPTVNPPTVEPTVAKPAVEPNYVPPKYIQRSTPSAERAYLPWVLLGAAAALLLGAGLVKMLNRPQPATEAQEPEAPLSNPSPAASIPPSTVPTGPAPQASLSPAPTTSVLAGATPVPTPGTDANASIQVAVKLSDDSWFQVIGDGKTEYEGILKKGEQRTWTAQKTLVLQVGNAGAVSASYNQGEAKLLGALGEVKDVTFTAAKANKPGEN